jgi:hypothetical protein
MKTELRKGTDSFGFAERHDRHQLAGQQPRAEHTCKIIEQRTPGGDNEP